MKLLRLFLLFFALWIVPTIANAANRFLTCNTTCTITAIDTSIWGTTSGGTGASVPGSSDAVILDAATCVGGVTCTATMGAGYNPTWQSLTMGACTASTTGCILDASANNNNFTFNTGSSVSLTGTGVRTFNCGSGTFTFTAAQGTYWDVTTKTNLTLSCASATLDFTTTGAQTGTRTFTGNTAFTYGTLKFGNTSGTGGFVTTINFASSTITTLNIDGVCNCRFQTGTGTITNAFTWNAAGSSSQIESFKSATDGQTATISVASGTSTINWAVLVNNLTFSGGGTFVCDNCMSATNSNTGITVNLPGASTSGRIIGGYLLKRDLPYWANDRGVILKRPVKPDNDNSPAFLNKAM